MGQMTGDGPLGDKERSSYLPVRPSFCNQRGDAALGGRQSFLTPSAAYAPQLFAGPFGPDRSSDLFETVERSLDRLTGTQLLPFPPSDDAEPEQRSSLAEGIADLLVLRNRPA